MSTSRRKPYIGTQRQLVIAFDVGTTFSGVSYAILEPGQEPQILGVTQFRGQQRVGGDSKIPSIVCYYPDGQVAAVGSETDLDTNPELAEIEGLSKAEWFKLHLRPPRLAHEQGFDVTKLPSLPKNKTAIDVFGDVLQYLLNATRQYIQERQGVDLWNSVESNIHFILSHPNGWEGKQQSDMRRAAVSAGLVKSTLEAIERVSFVTEGEASLHFCLNKNPDLLEKFASDGVLVVDCGGGTVDISAYTRAVDQSFKEIAPAECLLQGSVFVTRRAHDFLTEKLRESKYGNPEEIEFMTKYFDKTTKTVFKGSSKPYFVKFGRSSDNEPSFDIRAGGIKISGAQVAKFFEPAVSSIIEAIEDQCAKSPRSIKVICLVGGFGTSDYLHSRLDEYFKARKIEILRPDAYLNKAVAEGAVSYYIDHRVSVRVARSTFGVEVTVPYDDTDDEHLRRASQAQSAPSGTLRIGDIFSEILAKGTAVSEETEFRKSYYYELPRNEFDAFKFVSLNLKCYRGRASKPPHWIDVAPEHFYDTCEITADVKSIKRHLKPVRNGTRVYYRFELDVVLLFGLTELKAQIAWMENGVEKRSAGTVVYEDA